VFFSLFYRDWYITKYILLLLCKTLHTYLLSLTKTPMMADFISRVLSHVIVLNRLRATMSYLLWILSIRSTACNKKHTLDCTCKIVAITSLNGVIFNYYVNIIYMRYLYLDAICLTYSVELAQIHHSNIVYIFLYVEH